MEELLFCFGGDDDGGGGGGDSADDADSMDSGYDTSSVGMGTNTMGDSSDYGGDGGNDDPMGMASLAAEAERATGGRVDTAAAEAALSAMDSDYGGGGPVSSPVSTGVIGPSIDISGAINDFLGRPSRGSQYAGQAAYNAQLVSPVGTGTVLAPTVSTVPDQLLDSIIDPVGTGTVLAPTVSTVAPAGIGPTFAPTLANQPLTVGGQVAVMPYESYQRSPQQVFGYGGLTASPYSPDAISFQGGAPAAPVNPLGGDQIMQFDVGRVPTPAGTPDDRNFLERTIAGVGSLFDTQEQRAGVFDPTTGTFRQFDGQTTLQKTSDNVLADVLGNVLASATGVTPLVGRLDSKTYTPLAGGEDLLYQSSQGGLLSDTLGESLTPMSEVRAAQEAAMAGGDGDGGQRAPLIVPEQTPEEEREQSAFPQFTPREYKYQPFTSKFYTIPSRFTKPYGLLG
jgi:hypothetical protein